MEQTWYLFPGQTLENTKIEDRGKALIASSEGWKKINGYLTKKAEQQALIDEELAHRQYLKEGSKNMTKNWENSIEKIQQRRFEEHDKKVREREEDLYRRYHELRAEQAEERKHIVAEARKRMHMVKQDSRSLNSALLLTEVLTERRLQQEFDANLRAEEGKEDAEYAMLVKVNAQKEKEENAAKKKWRKDTDVKYCEELKKQIKEIQDNDKKEFEDKRAKEIEDNVRSIEEYKAIQEYENLLDKKNKANVKKQQMDFREERRQMQEQANKQNEAEDKIVKIYAQAKCVLDEKKKQKAKEFKDEQIRVREKIAAKLAKQAEQKASDEDKLIRAAQEELEKKLLEREVRDAEFKEKLRQERLEDRQRVIDRKKKEVTVKKELEEWAMVNRLKNDEVIKQYEQDKLQRLFNEKIEYRKVLFDQMKENKDLVEFDKHCSAQELQYYRKALEEEDTAFFSYADEVQDLAKSRGRSTVPIEKVVHNYKVKNDLEPKNKNLSHLKSKVPINNEEQ